MPRVAVEPHKIGMLKSGGLGVDERMGRNRWGGFWRLQTFIQNNLDFFSHIVNNTKGRNTAWRNLKFFQQLFGFGKAEPTLRPQLFAQRRHVCRWVIEVNGNEVKILFLVVYEEVFYGELPRAFVHTSAVCG